MAVETRPFDPAAYIDTPEAVAEYLLAAFETEDPAHVHRRGGAGTRHVAPGGGLTRAALNRALSPDGNPEFGAVLRVPKALGMGLSPRALAGA